MNKQLTKITTRNPKGAGRPKGSKNKSTAELHEILDNIVDWNEVAQRLFALSKGVLVQKKDDKGGVDVYEKEPDGFAAKTLIEFRFGKAKQSIEHSGTVKRVDVTRLPLDELIALRNAATRVLSTAN